MYARLTRIGTSLLAAYSLLSSAVTAAPTVNNDIVERAASGRLVFAHFMIGITADRTGPQDYDADIQRAQSMGIDAFALNIGVDPYTDQQLGYAYQSAANNNFKVFISFDFNWWNTGEATSIGQKIAQYANLPAQLKYNNAVFVSSFAGDGLDVPTMRSAVGQEIFFVPNFHPGQGDFSQIDGALNWMAWPNNGQNKAPTASANISVQQGDQAYMNELAGKPYLAPASAWFSTHYGPEVSYSKNWVFPSDLLWFNRWNDLLNLGSQFIEIVTWNDYGESHYNAPLNSPHYDDGASKWANDMPHDGWLDMAKPYIAAFHAGATKPDAYITEDQLIYWYRPQPGTVDCDSTDTTMEPANNASGNYFEGRPNGASSMQDAVFVVSLLTSPGTVIVNSGSNSQTFSAPAGASAFQVPMGIGQQSFALERNGQIVIGATSNKNIIDGCVCGLYNYNAYVGTIPQGQPFPDQMQPDGLNSLTAGLHVSTCSATPSLGTTTIPYGGPTAPGGATTTPANPPTTTTTTSPPTQKPTTTTTTTTTTPKPPTTTTKPTTTPPTTTPPTTTKVCHTITNSSQIRPTNCLQGCDVWAGPPGEDHPDHCDGT